MEDTVWRLLSEFLADQSRCNKKQRHCTRYKKTPTFSPPFCARLAERTKIFYTWHLSAAYLIEKVTSTDVRITSILQSLPHKMAENIWYEEITSLSPYVYVCKILSGSVIREKPILSKYILRCHVYTWQCTIQELRWDSERELFYDDIVHVEASAYTAIEPTS